MRDCGSNNPRPQRLTGYRTACCAGPRPTSRIDFLCRPDAACAAFLRKNLVPKGKHIFGTVKVGERGQIVIPKEAREIFDINPGDTLLVLGDEEQGIAVVKADVMKEVAVKILKGLGHFKGGNDDETK